MELFSGADHLHKDTQIISAFVRQLETDQVNDGDRREEGRSRLISPIVVQPISDDFLPVGECFEGIARDVSTIGIGFVCTTPIQHKLLAIRLKSRDGKIDVAGEVIRCEQQGAYFDVGCKLISKL